MAVQYTFPFWGENATSSASPPVFVVYVQRPLIRSHIFRWWSRDTESASFPDGWMVRSFTGALRVPRRFFQLREFLDMEVLQILSRCLCPMGQIVFWGA
jgi:hypothetical protein